MTKHFHFGNVWFFSPNDIVLEILWFVQMQFYKLKIYHYVFLDRRSFLRAIKPYLFSLFLKIMS